MIRFTIVNNFTISITILSHALMQQKSERINSNLIIFPYSIVEDTSLVPSSRSIQVPPPQKKNLAFYDLLFAKVLFIEDPVCVELSLSLSLSNTHTRHNQFGH